MKKTSKGDDQTYLNFTYKGQQYYLSIVDTARFFDVNYDIVRHAIVRDKMSDQAAADKAAEKGNHYPVRKKIRNNILYKTGLKA